MIKKSSLTKDFYKPHEIANLLGVTTRTIQNYTKRNLLEVEWTPTGRRLIPRDSLLEYLNNQGLLLEDDERIDVVYARVSTHKQEQNGDLDRQIQTLINFVVTQNPNNLLIKKDVASGFNDNRKSLKQILQLVQEDKVKRIFVNYKDRLTRFGFNYIKMICDFHNTEIIIVSNEKEDKSISEELAEDIISLIHSFSGKLYGLRGKIKDSIENDKNTIS